MNGSTHPAAATPRAEDLHRPDGPTTRLGWQTLPFDRLSPSLLYGMLRLRSAVFVVEQRCIYQDIDDVDRGAWFVLGSDPGGESSMVLASARVLGPGVRFREPSVGRVCTDPGLRGTGQGRELMRRAIALAGERFPGQSLRISAQAHLDRFYGDLGFRVDSEPYDEDGIPHIEMQRPARG